MRRDEGVRAVAHASEFYRWESWLECAGRRVPVEVVQRAGQGRVWRSESSWATGSFRRVAGEGRGVYRVLVGKARYVRGVG